MQLQLSVEHKHRFSPGKGVVSVFEVTSVDVSVSKKTTFVYKFVEKISNKIYNLSKHNRKL